MNKNSRSNLALAGLGVLASSLLLAQGVVFAAYPDTEPINNPTASQCRGNNKLLITNRTNLQRVNAKLKTNSDSFTSLSKQVNFKRKAFRKKFVELQNRLLIAGTDIAGQLGVDFVPESDYSALLADPKNLSGEKVPLIDFSTGNNPPNAFLPGPTTYTIGDPDTYSGFKGVASLVNLVFQAFKPQRVSPTVTGIPGQFYDSKLDNNGDGKFGHEVLPPLPADTSDNVTGKLDISAFLDVFFGIPATDAAGYTAEELERARTRARADRDKRLTELNQQGIRMYDLIVARDALIKNFNNSALASRLTRVKTTVENLTVEKTRLSRQKDNLVVTRRNCRSAK